VMASRKHDEIELPDGTVLYSYQRARAALQEIRRPRFSLSEAILVLLYAQKEKPINGRISMMKQVFLLINEILGKDQVQDAKYVPARYGMYSFLVTRTLTNLEYAGYLIREGRKGTRVERFVLSEKGLQRAARPFLQLPEEIRTTLMEKRKGWDQLGYDGILRYVYDQYKEYADKSMIRKRYASIEWGRGLG
jgi:uncharacterized protein YwgA